jgi:hypothetical protein
MASFPAIIAVFLDCFPMDAIAADIGTPLSVNILHLTGSNAYVGIFQGRRDEKTWLCFELDRLSVKL